MEQVTQKYTKYFYIILLIEIIWQLLEILVKALSWETTYLTIILLVLSVVNIMIVGSSLKHNIKQEFTECKATTKIARWTVPLLIVMQAITSSRINLDWIALSNQIMSVCIIEIWLSYRIKSIEHLEQLARRFSKDKEKPMLK